MDGTSCLEAGAGGAAPAVDADRIAGLLAQVGDKLVAVLGQLKAAAPHAGIYLVSYPRVLAEPAAPCPPDVPVPAPVATFLGELGSSFQAASRDAAERAGVKFVDAYGASSGHDACASADQRWVEGHATAGTVPYHPNAAGMRAAADLILSEIDQAQP